jgi:SAM-dependent methyltransferase
MPLPTNLKPRLQASYDAIAETYNAWAAKTPSTRLAHLQAFLAALPNHDGDDAAPQQVLELGCGAGLPVAAALLADPRRLRLAANDLSATQLRLARANLLASTAAVAAADGGPPPGLSAAAAAEEALDARVRFAPGDMMALDFPAASLAGVVAFYSIIHLPREEQTELLRRLHAWLAPGGLVVANFAVEEEESSVIDRWLDCDEGWMFWSAWGAERTVALLDEVGFEIISQEIKGDVVNAEFLWVLARKKDSESAADGRIT